MDEKERDLILADYNILKKDLNNIKGGIDGWARGYFQEQSEFIRKMNLIKDDDKKLDFLNTYIGKITDEMDKESDDYYRMERALYRFYLIFKHYPDEYNFKNQYTEIDDWYKGVIKKDFED